jgi:hypothetical protein
MIQQTTKRHAGLEKTTARFAEYSPNLFPLLHMPVHGAGWSVEPGDGCRGLPHHGAIRFDLPAQMRGASPVLSFSSRLPKRDSREDHTIPHPSGPVRPERSSSSPLCPRLVSQKKHKQKSDHITIFSAK